MHIYIYIAYLYIYIYTYIHIYICAFGSLQTPSPGPGALATQGVEALALRNLPVPGTAERPLVEAYGRWCEADGALKGNTIGGSG